MDQQWLQADKVELLFKDKVAYLQFIEDYEEQKEVIDEIKYGLADS